MNNRKLTAMQIRERLKLVRTGTIVEMAILLLVRRSARDQQCLLDLAEEREANKLCLDAQAPLAKMAETAPIVAGLAGRPCHMWSAEEFAAAKAHNNAAKTVKSIRAKMDDLKKLPHIAALLTQTEATQETE